MARRQLQASVEMTLVGMHAAVADQAAEMQRAVVLLRVLHSLKQRRVLEERAIMDRRGDTGKLLKHALARADVQMAHFRVAHLAFGQTHCRATGGKPGMGIGARELVDMGSLRQRDGIGVRAGVDAPAVHHDQHQRSRKSAWHKQIKAPLRGGTCSRSANSFVATGLRQLKWPTGWLIISHFPQESRQKERRKGQLWNSSCGQDHAIQPRPNSQGRSYRSVTQAHAEGAKGVYAQRRKGE